MHIPGWQILRALPVETPKRFVIARAGNASIFASSKPNVPSGRMNGKFVPKKDQGRFSIGMGREVGWWAPTDSGERGCVTVVSKAKLEAGRVFFHRFPALARSEKVASDRDRISSGLPFFRRFPLGSCTAAPNLLWKRRKGPRASVGLGLAALPHIIRANSTRTGCPEAAPFVF